jgi:hypothetical protein
VSGEFHAQATLLWVLIGHKGTRWRSRLKHCATSWKFAGSIRHDVTGIFFRSHYVSGVDSSSNRNKYQEYFVGSKGGQCVGLTTLPPSCADLLEVWNPQGLSRPVQGLLYFHLLGKTLGGPQSQAGRGGPRPRIPACSVAQALVARNLEGNISETFH